MCLLDWTDARVASSFGGKEDSSAPKWVTTMIHKHPQRV